MGSLLNIPDTLQNTSVLPLIEDFVCKYMQGNTLYKGVTYSGGGAGGMRLTFVVRRAEWKHALEGSLKRVEMFVSTYHIEEFHGPTGEYYVIYPDSKYPIPIHESVLYNLPDYIRFRFGTSIVPINGDVLFAPEDNQHFSYLNTKDSDDFQDIIQ